MNLLFTTVAEKAHIANSGANFARLIELLLEKAENKFATQACGNLLLTPHRSRGKKPIYWKIEAHSLQTPLPSLEELAKPHVAKFEEAKKASVPYTGPAEVYVVEQQGSNSSNYEWNGILIGNKKLANEIAGLPDWWYPTRVRAIPVATSVEDFKKLSKK